MTTYESASEEATQAIASALAATLVPGDVVTLEGPLGAGKTVFVRALARGLGVDPSIPITSPSYALANVYDRPDGSTFVHVDLYRIADDEELEALGFRDWLADGAIVAIEWPERSPVIGAVATLSVAIEDCGPEARRIRVTRRP